MTDSKDKNTEKKPLEPSTVQTVRIPNSVMDKLVMHMRRKGTKFQGYAMDLIREDIQMKESEAGRNSIPNQVNPLGEKTKIPIDVMNSPIENSPIAASVLSEIRSHAEQILQLVDKAHVPKPDDLSKHRAKLDGIEKDQKRNRGNKSRRAKGGGALSGDAA